MIIVSIIMTPRLYLKGFDTIIMYYLQSLLKHLLHYLSIKDIWYIPKEKHPAIKPSVRTYLF